MLLDFALQDPQLQIELPELPCRENLHKELPGKMQPTKERLINVLNEPRDQPITLQELRPIHPQSQINETLRKEKVGFSD